MWVDVLGIFRFDIHSVALISQFFFAQSQHDARVTAANSVVPKAVHMASKSFLYARVFPLSLAHNSVFLLHTPLKPPLLRSPVLSPYLTSSAYQQLNLGDHCLLLETLHSLGSGTPHWSLALPGSPVKVAGLRAVFGPLLFSLCPHTLGDSSQSHTFKCQFYIFSPRPYVSCRLVGQIVYLTS